MLSPQDHKRLVTSLFHASNPCFPGPMSTITLETVFNLLEGYVLTPVSAVVEYKEGEGDKMGRTLIVTPYK